MRRLPDDGRIAAFTLIMTLALLAMVGLVLDGGLALNAKSTARNNAAAAAREGAQHLDITIYRTTAVATLDQPAAATAARHTLNQLGVTGTVTTTPTTVTVTVTRIQTTQLLSLAGIRAITVTSSATAEVQHGIDAPGSL